MCKDLEGDGRGLFQRRIYAVAWKDQEKRQDSGNQCEARTM